MLICPHCHYRNRVGEFFCAKCGQAVSENGTHPLKAGTHNLEQALHLQVEGFTETLSITVEDEVVLGRQSGKTGNIRIVDLGDFGALEQGVSRQHARLRFVEGAYHIEDMNSANRTFLNGNLLRSNVPYRLRDGDIVRLAKLKMWIVIA